MNIVSIIQARMGSRRLPGKMLLPLLGRPLIAWICDRAQRAARPDITVVATSKSSSDDALVDWCQDHQVNVFRGAEEDVLSRYFNCALEFDASHVVRLTGDCPLLDWRVVDEVIDLCARDPSVDYATNCEPMTYPEGMNAEVMPMRILRRAMRNATLPSHREHVTPYVRFAPQRFKHAVLSAHPDLSHLRMTVDYEQDLLAMESLMKQLKRREILDTCTLEETVKTLESEPDIMAVFASKQRDLWRKEIARDEQRRIA